MRYEIKWTWADPTSPAYYEAARYQSSYPRDQLFDTPSMAVMGARAWTIKNVGRDAPTAAVVPVRVLREAGPRDVQHMFGKLVPYRPGTMIVEVWPEGT